MLWRLLVATGVLRGVLLPSNDSSQLFLIVIDETRAHLIACFWKILMFRDSSVLLKQRRDQTCGVSLFVEILSGIDVLFLKRQTLIIINYLFAPVFISVTVLGFWGFGVLENCKVSKFNMVSSRFLPQYLLMIFQS